MKHGLFSEEVMPSNILMGHPDPVGEPGEPGVPVKGEKGECKFDPGPTILGTEDMYIKAETLPVAKILDSGNRREFASGAVRDIQEGKGRCDLLPLDIVAQLMNDEIIRSISLFQYEGQVTYLFIALRDFSAHWDDGLTKTEQDIFMQHHSTMTLEVSKHFEEGAKKYGENNWQKGIPVHCYIDSAVRHYLKFLRGDKDEPHDRAFCWNIMCAIWTCKHKPELNEYDQRGEFLRKDLNVPKDVALSIDKGEE